MAIELPPWVAGPKKIAARWGRDLRIRASTKLFGGLGDRLFAFELGRFGRRAHGGRRSGAAADGDSHRVEIAGANLALMPCRAIAVRFRRELLLLELGIGGHAAIPIAAGEIEHRVVEHVEAGQGHELELVAHGAEFALEAGDRRRVEFCFPVERW